ncbi:MAG: phosphotransferase, partial [Actinobacteria bacterium]|nr:phosphotransferase [Actinomycetota bacterium]
MKPLRHGYTNNTRGDGTAVVKRYLGPDASARAERERAMLLALPGRVPVPPVLGFEDESLTMGFIGGTHGQELLEAGQGRGVLHACGAMLRQIHHADLARAHPALGDALPGGTSAVPGRAGALPGPSGALPGPSGALPVQGDALPGRPGALAGRIGDGQVLVHGD